MGGARAEVEAGPNIGIKSTPLPTDAGLCSMYMADDVITAPYSIRDGCQVKVPDTPGMGFEIDQQKLKRYMVWSGSL